jgi:hypothetical protein
MIRHNTPGKEPVALLVKVDQGVGHVFGDGWIAQMARAGTAIEKLLYDRTGKALNLPTLVGAKIAVELVCGLNDGLALRFDAIQNGSR